MTAIIISAIAVAASLWMLALDLNLGGPQPLE